MGGCCCGSSRRVEWNSPAQFYHNPVVSEERQPLSSGNGAASAFPTSLLVDTNLETSLPDNYTPPPAPIPYEANAGSLNSLEGSINKREAPVQTNNSDPVGEINISNSDDIVTKETDDELEKSGELKKSSAPFLAPVECPTCLEEYDEENPKIITKCEHHFHLSCILEWMERSDTCPVCDQEMIINFPVEE